MDALNQIFRERYRELFEGMPPGEPTWVTTGGPEGGLHGTLESMTSDQASRVIAGSSIAAHTEHLRWAIAMVNDYFRGVEPASDWSESWLVRSVDEASWRELRDDLKQQGDTLLKNIESSHSWDEESAVNGALASLAHTAYHLGVLRQLRKQVLEGDAVRRKIHE